MSHGGKISDTHGAMASTRRARRRPGGLAPRGSPGDRVGGAVSHSRKRRGAIARQRGWHAATVRGQGGVLNTVGARRGRFVAVRVVTIAPLNRRRSKAARNARRAETAGDYL